MTRWKDGEMGTRRNKETGKRGDEERGVGGDGEMGGRGDGQTGVGESAVVARPLTLSALRLAHAHAFLDSRIRAPFFWVV